MGSICNLLYSRKLSEKKKQLKGKCLAANTRLIKCASAAIKSRAGVCAGVSAQA